MMTPDVVKRPMRQAFGIGDGRTLSVVKDMERKSPVIITMTTAGQNRMPVIIRPTIRKSTVTIFLMMEFSV